jgi:PAS domain-containing protein
MQFLASTLESWCQVLEPMPDAVIVCSPDGRICCLNAAARQFYVTPPSVHDATSFSLYDATGETSLAACDQPLVRALQGERVHNQQLVMRHTRLGPMRVSVSAGPVRGYSGELIGAVVVTRVEGSFRAAPRSVEAIDIAKARAKATSA